MQEYWRISRLFGKLSGKFSVPKPNFVTAPQHKYDGLSDITDVAAARVITYYANDVDRISKIVERDLRLTEKTQ